MKKQYLKIMAIAVFALLFGQMNQVNAQQALKYCGQLEATQELYRNNPGLKEKVEAFEQQQARSSHRVTGIDTTIYIIPIVFHIIHGYGYEAISDAQVIDAVRILNVDYRRLNPDTSNVVPAFKALIGDARIVFRLAQKDPNGMPTNGIDRVYSPKTNAGGEQSKLNDWDPTKYLNVWTTSTLGSNGVAGYSNYPSTAQFNPKGDGVIILSNYIGSIGTGTVQTSRALTHEIGHYLNLAHVWGSNNQPGQQCGDDGVTDTPISIGWTTCNLSSNDVCTVGVQENVQNYMEYSYCSNMFSMGQVDRMRTALTSPTAGRNNLSDSVNLKATGVLNNPPLIPVPIADFSPNAIYVCKGSSINLNDLSWRGTPTAWKWVLPGSENGVYTTQNPTVKYATAGAYDIKLVVQNEAGSDSTTRTALVFVTDDAAPDAIPYKEDFEEPGAVTTSLGWKTTNQYNDNVAWVKTTQAAYYGKQSVMLGNFNTKDSSLKDALISPNFDFSKATDPKLSFKRAYAKKKNTNADNLRIYYSTNCGANWAFASIIYSNKLATYSGLLSTRAFTPADLTAWKDTTINLPSTIIGKSSVLFKFEYTYALAGNNLYLDDIGFYPDKTSLITGQAEMAKEIGTWLAVSPNPVAAADQELKVSFNLTESKDVTFLIYDITGRMVQKTELKGQSEGYNETMLKLAQLNSGVYLLKFATDKTTKQIKIIVE